MPANTTRADQLRTWQFLQDLAEQIRAADSHLIRAANIAESIDDDRFGFAVSQIEEIGAAVSLLKTRLKVAGFSMGSKRDSG